jgi:hypothetical protein
MREGYARHDEIHQLGPPIEVTYTGEVHAAHPAPVEEMPRWCQVFVTLRLAIVVNRSARVFVKGAMSTETCCRDRGAMGIRKLNARERRRERRDGRPGRDDHARIFGDGGRHRTSGDKHWGRC